MTADFRKAPAKVQYKLSGFCFSMYVAALADYEGRYSDDIDYPSLLCDEMEKGTLAVWGCPERDFKILFTNNRKDIKRATEIAIFSMKTSGRLCFGDGGDLDTFGIDDGVFETHYFERSYNPPIVIDVESGALNVEVHRHFPWEHGHQDARLPVFGAHYSILVEPATEFVSKRYHGVPWHPLLTRKQ